MPETLLNPYCSLDDVKAELRNNNALLDDVLIKAINAASRWVDQVTGRDWFFHDFSAAYYEVSPDDIHEEIVSLPMRPIISITEVREAGNVLSLLNDVRIVAEVGVLRRVSGVWESSYETGRRVEVKGTFGFAQASSADVPSTIPQNVRLACAIAASALSGHYRKEVVGLDGEKTESIETKIPRRAFDLLPLRTALV